MRSRSLLAVIAVGVVLSTAACTSQGAATGTSTHAAPAVKLTAANFVSSITAAQKSAKSAHMQMVTTAAGTTISAQGDVSSDGTASKTVMSMTMKLPSLPNVSLKYVGGMVYLDLGAQSQNKYVEINPSDQSDPLAKSFSGILNDADPSNAVAQLKGAIKSVKIAGPAVTLDGVQATPYTVAIDTSAATKALGLSASASASLPAEIDYTYWIGTDDLLRKMTFSESGTSEQIEFSHWGEPVSVHAPTAGQITSIPGL